MKTEKGLAKDGGEDATVTCDLSGLADLVHNRRDELMAYLARHPGCIHDSERTIRPPCARRALGHGGGSLFVLSRGMVLHRD